MHAISDKKLRTAYAIEKTTIKRSASILTYSTLAAASSSLKHEAELIPLQFSTLSLRCYTDGKI